MDHGATSSLRSDACNRASVNTRTLPSGRPTVAQDQKGEDIAVYIDAIGIRTGLLPLDRQLSGGWIELA